MSQAVASPVRRQWRRRFALAWWGQAGLTLLPLALLLWLPGSRLTALPQLGMPSFLLGLASLFLSLPLFRAYKHALIATERAFDGEAEQTAWAHLARCRRTALLGAALPAWIGAGALTLGLEAVPALLLTFGSLLLLYLYRLPRQLA